MRTSRGKRERENGKDGGVEGPERGESVVGTAQGAQGQEKRER